MAYARRPDELDTKSRNPAQAWLQWKKAYEIYVDAAKLSVEDGKVKVSLLLNLIGEEGQEIYDNFEFRPEQPAVGDEPLVPGENKYDLDTVLAKFDAHFKIRDARLSARLDFWLNLKRHPEHDFATWDHIVRRAAKKCQYPADIIRDKLVTCCEDEATLSVLFNESFDTLTLEKTESIIGGREEIKKSVSSYTRTSVDAITKKQPKFEKYQQQRSVVTPPYQKQRDGKCSYCGFKHRYGKKYCTAAGVTCSVCNKVGHFDTVCRQKPVNEVDAESSQSDGNTPQFETSPERFVGMVDTDHIVGEACEWRLTMKTASDTLSWCVDTGAQVSVMPKQIYKQRYGTLCKPDKKLTGAGNQPLRTIGFVRMKLTSKRRTLTEKVYIVENTKRLLLGAPAIHKLGLMHNPDEQIELTIRAVAYTQRNSLRTATDVKQAYPELFKGIGKMKGQYSIKLRDDSKPFRQTVPRRVPIPLLPALEKEINALKKLGIIEEVNEPTDWCAPIVVVPKNNSEDVRLCVDLTKLNDAVKRELYPMPTVENTLQKIAKGSVFTKLDAKCGFYQMELAPECRKLTTFITPSGRYFYNRLPYGIASAPEVFQKKMNEILSGIPGNILCHMDDIIIACTQEDYTETMKLVLDRLREEGVTLNEGKCVFSATKIEYLGQVVGNGGISKDPKKVEAIREFPAPRDITELRRFLGMANQLMKFSPNLAELGKPLRDLLKKDSDWCWGPSQIDAFSKIKHDLSSDIVLAMYSPDKETVLSADSSSYGLGAVLMQKQHDNALRPVAYASRSLTQTEQRYAQIEKEALAITWSMDHWKELLIGMRALKIETDHKPLVPLLSTKLLDELPVRVQRFRMRLMKFNYSIVHVPGKLLYTADALSRCPLPNYEDIDNLRDSAELFVHTVMVNLPASDRRLDETRRELEKDDVLSKVMEHVRTGWPKEKSTLSGPIKKYWDEQASLTVHDGLLLKSNRIVIPPALRKDVLRCLHDSHQGITKTRLHASQSCWWPGMSKDIEETVNNCNSCLKFKRDRIEPMRGTEFPDRPWSRIGADFFQLGKSMYLLAVDYYSRDVEICLVTRTVDTAETISKFKKIFSRHGICDILVTDNSTLFVSKEFSTFAGDWNFEHITSSPRFPQSNGEAERAVQTVKNLLKKSDDRYLALLNYRNTPLQNGYSPAQLSMGCRLRTKVSCHPSQLIPETVDQADLREREKEYRVKIAQNYDRRHRVVPSDKFSIGDKVWLPDCDTEGVVERLDSNPRSIIVKTRKGMLRRNRRMIRKQRRTEKLNICDPQDVSEYVYNHSRTSDLEQPNLVQSDNDETATGSEVRRSTRIRTPTQRLIEQC